jgi:GT2 family glycosyltransferase
MGLSRELFLKIGGFGDLRHGQDIEFSHRIIKSGAKVLYISDAVVYHKRRTSIKKFFRQVFNWGTARINLYKLDKSMLEILHVAPAMALLFLLLLLLGSILSQGLWVFTRFFLVIGSLVLLGSALHAAYKYKSMPVFFLVLIVMPLQVIGYGSGFIWAYFYRVLLGRPEFVGFKKHYYK